MQFVRAQADVGDGDVGHLANLLTLALKQHGREEGARQFRRFGLNVDGSTASEWKDHGRRRRHKDL